MNCHLLRPLFSAYVDHELSPAEIQRVRQHIYDCAECAEFIKELDEIRMSMLEMPAPPEPKLGFDQFYASNRPRPARRFAITFAAVTVSLVGAFLAANLLRPASETQAVRASIDMNREIARDQMMAAESDPTTGASLVHLAGFSSP